LIIKHKKRGKKRGKRNDPLTRKVANEPRNKFICPTRKYWGERQRYKYLTIHHPLGVSDSQETQERNGDLLGVTHVITFSLTSETHEVDLEREIKYYN
jgi:hypothetical protein